MISEMEWNQALRNPDVHELARQAATLLQSRGLTTPVAGVMDWALELALGGRQISMADYYAAGFLILNPWMLERVARKIHKRHPAEHSAKGTIPPEALRQRWERRSGLLKRWSQSVGVYTGISGRARAYEDMLSWLNQIPWTANMLPQIKQELLTLIEHSGQDVEDWREKTLRSGKPAYREAVSSLSFRARGRIGANCAKR